MKHSRALAATHISMPTSTNSRSEATTHPEAADFYLATLTWLLERKLLTRDVKLLVVCGGELDRDVLSRLGFRSVTISNLESDREAIRYAPFARDTEDVEALTFQDGEFDFCIAHNGLHHCLSPHRGLLEMFRVAREGIVVFEPRDSFLTRCGVRLNFGQDYETAAVAANGCVAGGVTKGRSLLLGCASNLAGRIGEGRGFVLGCAGDLAGGMLGLAEFCLGILERMRSLLGINWSLTVIEISARTGFVSLIL